MQSAGLRMEPSHDSAWNTRELLSAGDLQIITGLSRASVYALFNRANMPVVKIGGRKFMHKDLFLDWLKEQAVMSVQK